MATRYTSTATSILAAGALGASLYTAATAQSARSTLGVGYTAHGQLLAGQDAGAGATAPVAVDPGTTGQVLTVGDAGLPVWRAAASNSNTLTVTRYYASDGTAEAKGYTASISGTGSSSTATLGVTSTSCSYGTGVETAPRIVWTLPTGTLWVTVTVEITAASGVSTGGYRWLVVALRDAPNGGAPTRLWGYGLGDNGNYAYGSLMGGGNGSTAGPVGMTLGASTNTRVTLNPRFGSLSLAHAAVSGTPAGWAPPQSIPAVTGNASTLVIPDSANNSTGLVLNLQSFGTGSTTSITAKVTIDAVVGP